MSIPVIKCEWCERSDGLFVQYIPGLGRVASLCFTCNYHLVREPAGDGQRTPVHHPCQRLVATKKYSQNI